MSDLFVQGGLLAQRLFDVGYAINLARVKELVPSATTELSPSAAQSIKLPNPPLTVHLPKAVLGPDLPEMEVSARIYDFGTISIRLRLPPRAKESWADYTAWGIKLAPFLRDSRQFDEALLSLRKRIDSAIERPHVAPVNEDYIIFRLASLTNALGEPQNADLLTDDLTAPLLLGETREVTVAARQALLSHRYSYYPEELAVFAWDQALVLAPGSEETDVEALLELANAQLLELRVYDDLLDHSVQKMYDAIEHLRSRRRRGNSWRRLLADVQTTLVDTTEIVERVENALKFTDDVYLARIYGAALDVFRIRIWRSSVDRKLQIMQDTASMLNSESQAHRSELLEIAIVALIVVEILMSIFS